MFDRKQSVDLTAGNTSRFCTCLETLSRMFLRLTQKVAGLLHLLVWGYWGMGAPLVILSRDHLALASSQYLNVQKLHWRFPELGRKLVLKRQRVPSLPVLAPLKKTSPLFAWGQASLTHEHIHTVHWWEWSFFLTLLWKERKAGKEIRACANKRRVRVLRLVSCVGRGFRDQIKAETEWKQASLWSQGAKSNQTEVTLFKYCSYLGSWNMSRAEEQSIALPSKV